MTHYKIINQKKGITLHFNKLESYSQKDALSYIWLKPRVFLILSMYFRWSPLGKRKWLFNPPYPNMLCAKFGWYFAEWFFGGWNVESPTERQQTDKLTTDNLSSSLELSKCACKVVLFMINFADIHRYTR